MALLIPALRRFRSVGRPSFVCTSIAQMVLSPIAIAVFLVAVLMAPRVSIAELEVFDYDRVLGSGINLGDALDAPQEGAWGVILHSSYFRAIREAGFASVRIPIRWSAHAAAHSPYTIDPVFFRRVDWAINEALSQHLAAVIDVHHFIEMNQDPLGNSQKLLALWSQIAARYRDEPPNLFFELFNEPQDKFSDSRWNALLPQLLNVIRASNPTRMVIVGPGYWNSLHHLSTLQLPRDDQRTHCDLSLLRAISLHSPSATVAAGKRGMEGYELGLSAGPQSARSRLSGGCCLGRSAPPPDLSW